jgi:polysaccharide deacetylase family protein (PEP-CTERM system associated)
VRPALLLSFDFEDWHQLVHRMLGVDDWDVRGEALERQTAALLDLVAEIVARGHEPASHGFGHERVHRQTRDEFRRDVAQSVEVIERHGGRRPLAYRAPAFSINRETPWAYEELADLGFRYDSSLYDSPKVPNRIRGIPAAPYRLELDGRELWELPISVARVGSRAIPVGGGSYWRLLPERLLFAGLRRATEANQFPVLYFHPYELDPEPLRARLPPSPSARQRLKAVERAVWRNAGRGLVARRLRAAAREFRLVSYEQAYGDIDQRYGTRTRSLSREGVLV